MPRKGKKKCLTGSRDAARANTLHQTTTKSTSPFNLSRVAGRCSMPCPAQVLSTNTALGALRNRNTNSDSFLAHGPPSSTGRRTGRKSLVDSGCRRLVHCTPDTAGLVVFSFAFAQEVVLWLFNLNSRLLSAKTKSRLLLHSGETSRCSITVVHSKRERGNQHRSRAELNENLDGTEARHLGLGFLFFGRKSISID